jgi:hypothetical protein
MNVMVICFTLEIILIENFPSLLVVTPFVVPFSITFAPGSAKPFSSSMIPVITLPLCANIWVIFAKSAMVIIMIIFFMYE